MIEIPDIIEALKDGDVALFNPNLVGKDALIKRLIDGGLVNKRYDYESDCNFLFANTKLETLYYCVGYFEDEPVTAEAIVDYLAGDSIYPRVFFSFSQNLSEYITIENILDIELEGLANEGYLELINEDDYCYKLNVAAINTLFHDSSEDAPCNPT